MPAADSGTIYATLDERCNACEVLGGPEGACIGRSGLRMYPRAHPGYECPRRELYETNELAFRIALLSVNEHLRHLCVPTIEAETELWERPALLERIALAMRSKRVIDFLYPPTKKDEADGSR